MGVLMLVEEDRAWKALHQRVRPRMKGDDVSRLQALFVKHVRWADGHWIWTSSLSSNGSRIPAFSYAVVGTYNPKTQQSRKRLVSAFNFMMRTFFPEQNVREHLKYARLCDEPRCISPYHRVRGLAVSAGPLRALTREQVISVYNHPGGEKALKSMAADLGVTSGCLYRIRRGEVYRDWYAAYFGREAPRPGWADLDKINEKRRLKRGNG